MIKTLKMIQIKVRIQKHNLNKTRCAGPLWVTRIQITLRLQPCKLKLEECGPSLPRQPSPKARDSTRCKPTSNSPPGPVASNKSSKLDLRATPNRICFQTSSSSKLRKPIQRLTSIHSQIKPRNVQELQVVEIR